MEDVSFLGSIVRTRIVAGDDVVLSFDQFNDPSLSPPSVGDTITVSFPIEASLILEGAASGEDIVEQAIAET